MAGSGMTTSPSQARMKYEVWKQLFVHVWAARDILHKSGSYGWQLRARYTMISGEPLSGLEMKGGCRMSSLGVTLVSTLLFQRVFADDDYLQPRIRSNSVPLLRRYCWSIQTTNSLCLQPTQHPAYLYSQELKRALPSYPHLHHGSPLSIFSRVHVVKNRRIHNLAFYTYETSTWRIR